MLLATHQNEVGAALIDWHTPLHLGVGVAAGVFGISTHVATFLFIGVRTAALAYEEGAGHALFSTDHGQSNGNEMMDLLSEFVGLYLGGKARSMITGLPSVDGLGGKIIGQSVPRTAPHSVAQEVMLSRPAVAL